MFLFIIMRRDVRQTRCHVQSGAGLPRPTHRTLRLKVHSAIRISHTGIYQRISQLIVLFYTRVHDHHDYVYGKCLDI